MQTRRTARKHGALRIPAFEFAYEVYLLAVMCQGCSLYESNAPQLLFPVEPPTIALTSNAPTSGVSNHEVTVDGKTRQFIVLAPPFIRRRHPLLVYLHGALQTRGATGQRRIGIGSHERLMRCLFGLEFQTLEPIIVMPVSTLGAGGEWWTQTESAFVVGLVDALKRNWPIDAQRTVVAGFSNGGIGAWTLARLYPERFGAAIAIAFDAGAVGETRVPVFAIQGTRDELFDYETIERRIEALTQRGYPVTFVGKYRGTHFTGCAYAREVGLAREWLVQDVWAAPPTSRDTPD